VGDAGPSGKRPAIRAWSPNRYPGPSAEEIGFEPAAASSAPRPPVDPKVSPNPPSTVPPAPPRPAPAPAPPFARSPIEGLRDASGLLQRLWSVPAAPPPRLEVPPIRPVPFPPYDRGRGANLSLSGALRTSPSAATATERAPPAPASESSDPRIRRPSEPATAR